MTILKVRFPFIILFELKKKFEGVLMKKKETYKSYLRNLELTLL